MQEKLTRQASNALILAKKTAQMCSHSYVGTEHMLIGLVKEKEGTAGKVLRESGVKEKELKELIDMPANSMGLIQK